MLTIAEVLSLDNSVELLLDTHLATLEMDKVLSQMESLHNLDLSKVKTVCAPIGVGSKVFERYSILKQYDVLICNTDGSIFYSSAKKSFLHFQVPFENTNAKGIWGKMKLNSWKKAVYNSNFTKDLIERTWNIKGEVIYPPVDVEKFKVLKKKKQIVTVGRFFSGDKMKKHQLMVDVFKELVKENNLKDWSLHLAGGCSDGDEEYLKELKENAKGGQIFFHPNISFSDLVTLYAESSIYWHAKGFGEEDPKNFEHFGITTVEAMASGCVPVVIKKGGQLEIVEDEVSGLFWETTPELKLKTLELIKDNKKMEELSGSAVKRSRSFSKESFSQKILELTNE